MTDDDPCIHELLSTLRPGDTSGLAAIALGWLIENAQFIQAVMETAGGEDGEVVAGEIDALMMHVGVVET